jgi:hypothetical protein
MRPALTGHTVYEFPAQHQLAFNARVCSRAAGKNALQHTAKGRIPQRQALPAAELRYLLKRRNLFGYAT